MCPLFLAHLAMELAAFPNCENICMARAQEGRILI